MGDEDVARTAAAPRAVGGLADLSGAVVADRYRLSTLLGQGAMANVYRALDTKLDREVAVKLFHPGQGAAVRSRFGAEAQALARLSHPGLIGIYDAGVEGDRPYLVMQLVDGDSLRERLLGGPLDSDAVVLLGARLATALAHVHGNGIVHRDIKPSNIVLDGNSSPHLADFGIALLLDAARMTGSNEIMGTAAYLSPEQILGADVGAPADVYSLGLVLLECLTGELEYPGVSKVESALARLHRPPRIPAGVPAVLSELLTAMTAREPEDRPTAGDCAAWFWTVREHSGMSSRAARLIAAQWLSRKGKQATLPMFTGWRRFAVAGSGIAMAIVASTFLFTSLLPRVMPPTQEIGSQPLPQQNIGHTTGPFVDLRAMPPALHMAAALSSAGHSSSATAHQATSSNPALSSSASSSQLSVTSALTNTSLDTTATPPPDDVLQDGPGQSSDSTPTDSSPPSSDGSVENAPPSDPASPSSDNNGNGNGQSNAPTDTTTGDLKQANKSGNNGNGGNSQGHSHGRTYETELNNSGN